MIDTIAITAKEETEARDSALETETDLQSSTMIETIATAATEETEAIETDHQSSPRIGTIAVTTTKTKARDFAQANQQSKTGIETIAVTAKEETEATEVALGKETAQQSNTIIETIAITATKETEAKDSALETETDQQSITTIEPLALTPTKDVKPRTIALDPEIIKALHPKARIIRALDLPTTPPSRLILINTRSPIPSPPHTYPERWLGIYKSYHLKLHPSPRAEYASASAIHHTLPYASFIAKPLAWGTLSQDPSTSFLLSEYHDLDFNPQNLNLPRFIATLASLHLRSVAQSGTYGFDIPTHDATLPLLTKTWEGYFTATLHHLLAIEKEVHGPQTTEMQGMVTMLFRQVIPRLLRPLESGIKPTLLHGNISVGTVGTSRRTGAPMVCEPCAFWGHNEFELCAFVGGGEGAGGEGVGGGFGGVFGGEALRLYRRFVRVSEPREDFGERMRLYKLVGLVRGSCKGGEGREELVVGMRGVVGRFWGDWEG